MPVLSWRAAPLRSEMDPSCSNGRHLLPYFVSLWKTGTATISQERLVAWYRLASATAYGTGGTTVNTASHIQTEVAPASLSQDAVHFAVLAGSRLTPRVTASGTVREVSWDSSPDPSCGSMELYCGHMNTGGGSCTVTTELLDSGRVLSTQEQMASLDSRTLCSS
jgi:hypothetical protein